MHYQKATENSFAIKIKYGKAQTIGPSRPILLENSKQLMPTPSKTINFDRQSAERSLPHGLPKNIQHFQPFCMKEKSIHSLMFHEHDVVSPFAAFIWCVILCNWFYYHISDHKSLCMNQPNNSPPRYYFGTSCINYISSQTIIINTKNDLSCTRRFKLKDKLMINSVHSMNNINNNT